MRKGFACAVLGVLAGAGVLGVVTAAPPSEVEASTKLAERWGAKELGKAWGFERTSRWVLDRAVELKPELAERAKKVKDERAAVLGPGFDVVDRAMIAGGVDREGMWKTIMTDGIAAKLDASLRENAAGVVEQQARFTKVAAMHGPVALLLALNPAFQGKPEAELAAGMVSLFGAEATVDDRKVGVELEAPASWSVVSATGSSAIGLRSNVGTGDEHLRVFLGHTGVEIVGDVKKKAWQSIHDRTQYETTGGKVILMRDTRLNDDDALEVTLRGATKAKDGSKGVVTIRQLCALRGYWTLTTQLMLARQTDLSEEECLSEMDKHQAVLERAAGTLKLKEAALEEGVTREK